GTSLTPSQTGPIIRLKTQQLEGPDLAAAFDLARHARHRTGRARRGRVAAGLTGTLAVIAVATVLLATMIGPEPGRAPRSSSELPPRSEPPPWTAPASSVPTSPGSAPRVLPPLSMHRPTNQPKSAPTSPAPGVSSSPSPRRRPAALSFRDVFVGTKL